MEPIILYGALASPYALKVRALLRYRRIPHIWQMSTPARTAALQQVKVPVVPVLGMPDGRFLNDSTVVIRTLETLYDNGRSVIPDDPGHSFLAALIEDFADEWLTKAMFGYRWLHLEDRELVSLWLSYDQNAGHQPEAIDAFAQQFKERQMGRLDIVGATAANFPLIEATVRAVAGAFEAQVASASFLFGTRPSVAEFAIFGQLVQLASDPTPSAMLRREFPLFTRWIGHTDDLAGIEGAWDSSATLSTAATGILKVVDAVYLPMLAANEAALAAGQPDYRFTALGHDFTQPVFRYHLRCLEELRRLYAALPPQARSQVDAQLGNAALFTT